jgi:hypothetical protein
MHRVVSGNYACAGSCCGHTHLHIQLLQACDQMAAVQKMQGNAQLYLRLASTVSVISSCRVQMRTNKS